MKRTTAGQLALAGLFVALLAACSAEPVKESPAAPAPLAQAAATVKPAPATTQLTVAPKPAAVNPLNDPGSILAKRSVFFPLDNYAVDPEFQPMLKAHAAYLSGHPGASVAIEGNCDERGSREYNLALGQRRADAVGKTMLLLGASSKQIETISFGEEKPRAAGHDESSWSRNRRSDIVYKREQ